MGSSLSFTSRRGPAVQCDEERPNKRQKLADSHNKAFLSFLNRTDIWHNNIFPYIYDEVYAPCGDYIFMAGVHSRMGELYTSYCDRDSYMLDLRHKIRHFPRRQRRQYKYTFFRNIFVNVPRAEYWYKLITDGHGNGHGDLAAAPVIEQLKNPMNVYRACLNGTGGLTMVKWAHNKSIPWNEDLCMLAAEKGTLDIIMYAHEQGCPWNGETTYEAAKGNHMDILQYAHDNGCPWGAGVCEIAAKNNNMEMLIYCHENGCPWDRSTCRAAAENNNLDMLKYAHQNGCRLDNLFTCEIAASFGNLEMLKYAHENGCELDRSVCPIAALNGHLEMLQYAHEHGAPWNSETCKEAARGGKLACLQFALEHGCPWDSYTGVYAAGSDSDGCMQCIKYLQGKGYSWNNPAACSRAAYYGRLDALQYLHEHIGAPWDEDTCSNAACGNNLPCLQYARKHGCPWDTFTLANAVDMGSLDCLVWASENGCPWDQGTEDFVSYFRRCHNPAIRAWGAANATKYCTPAMLQSKRVKATLHWLQTGENLGYSTDEEQQEAGSP